MTFAEECFQKIKLFSYFKIVHVYIARIHASTTDAMHCIGLCKYDSVFCIYCI